MDSDEVAYNLLKKIGFKVEKIPTSDKKNKKEADFLIEYQSSIALVEAKLKEDDQKIIDKKEKDLASGEVSVVEANLGRNETYSGIIRKATKQLQSSSDKKHDFKILLFIASGINPEAKRDQMKDTVYGSTLILEGNTTKPCYFFRNSDFFRRKTIDAVIIATMEVGKNNISTIELCINPYADSYEELKNSEFLQPFDSAIIDPIELEKKGLAYIPDDNIDRKTTDFEKHFPLYNHINHHLQKKYKLQYLVNIDFNANEYSIRTKA